MRGSRKSCVVALCGVVLIMSACGNISNEVSDADDIKVEHTTLERVDGTSADVSISEEAYDDTFSETGFVDGEYQTIKTDNQSGYCDNVITADAEGNRTSAAGFYEAFIQDGYLHINGGIALHSWEHGNHIEKFYPYSEYRIELADSCYYQETFVGETPEKVRTADEMNQLLQQAKTIDQLTIEISNGEITKMSFSGWEE